MGDLEDALESQGFRLGRDGAAVAGAIEAWRRDECTRRLWERDASLWTGAEESRWLGWLDAVARSQSELETYEAFADDARTGELRHAVVLGMGGSSLCPDVLARTFGPVEGYPVLRVLDSTVPAQIHSLAAELDLARTVFVVSSKSGTTIEPNTLLAWFYDQLEQRVGSVAAGSHFIAVTDPGSQLEDVASARAFRAIAHGVPEIGGRFSALSAFGLVPAALMGLDVGDLLERAEPMVHACRREAPERNPGVLLGLTLGALARAGRDKLTFVISPAVSTLGAWLEQLVAESTGKHGKGIVPVADEEVAAPARYGADRLFVYVRIANAASDEQDAHVDALAKAGHPVVRIEVGDAMDLGAELFRWEVATATAGAVLGIDPFDQPDVESAKVAARSVMTRYEETGALAEEEPTCRSGELALFAAPGSAPDAQDADALLGSFLGTIGAGDYFGIDAFLEMNAAYDARLQAIRHLVRDETGVATCLGYGPRFLHSTGQLQKGGPESGVFLQITSDDARDLEVPGHGFSFGVLKRAQAQGDFDVLVARGRRTLRVHLAADVARGLAELEALVERALATARSTR